MVNSEKKYITSGEIESKRQMLMVNRGLEPPTSMHDCILPGPRSIEDSLLLGFSWPKPSRVESAFPIFGKALDAGRGVFLSGLECFFFFPRNTPQRKNSMFQPEKAKDVALSNRLRTD